MDDKEEQVIERLFEICINLNDTILKKEQSEIELTFIDHYAFQASSYIVSIIHNMATLNRNSLCGAFIIRALVECISLMKMYSMGLIPLEATELINTYNYIAEYNIYKRYKNQLDGKQFDFNQIERNFKTTEEKYKKYSNLSLAAFKKLINSKMPFLLDEFSFDKIVQKYGAEYYQYYKMLSVIVHPSDLLITYPVLRKQTLKTITTNLFIDFIEIVIKEYHTENINLKKTLRQEMKYIFVNPLNNMYMNLATTEKNALYKVADIIEKEFKENTMSYICIEIGNSIEEMALDKTFGFSEIVKCKYKPVIEMLAMQNYYRKLPHIIEKKHLEQLITKHTIIRLLDVYGIDSSKEMKIAFELMKKEKQDLTREVFDKTFKNALGFIPEKTSINSLVRSLIDDVVTKNEISNAHMKMVYDEAQLLSHATGYMISSNSGAFMEYSSVIPFIDYLTSVLLESYIAFWKLYDGVEGGGKHSHLIALLSDYLKDFSKASKEKNEMDRKWQDYKVSY